MPPLESLGIESDDSDDMARIFKEVSGVSSKQRQGQSHSRGKRVWGLRITADALVDTAKVLSLSTSPLVRRPNRVYWK
ncbi:hypothetical protein ACRQ5Q_08980 [Bradyrhizobium sp. PMVTL-01]|uniref:hypothetical protein n=1 Tax=Bradyrhizobium sp. PMVTL-01 TaxID=3434999 RepID=UPI003F70E8DC